MAYKRYNEWGLKRVGSRTVPPPRDSPDNGFIMSIYT
jgi:hypothetical protein